MNTKKIWQRSLMAAAILLGSASICSAAGLRITNPDIKLDIAPGSYDSGEIAVENTTQEPVTVRAYLEDWVLSDSEGNKEFMPKGSTSRSASDWLTFYPADFTLPPNGSQIVRFTVQVPEGAEGGYYTILFFETYGGEVDRPNEKGEIVRVQVMNRLGAMISVDAVGTTQRSIEVLKLDLFEKLNDLYVTLDFNNEGNANVYLEGTFNILDAEGVVYARGQFDRTYAMPGQKASARAVVQSTHLSAGSYDALLTLDLGSGVKLVKEASFAVEASGAISAPTIKD